MSQNTDVQAESGGKNCYCFRIALCAMLLLALHFET